MEVLLREGATIPAEAEQADEYVRLLAQGWAIDIAWAVVAASGGMPITANPAAPAYTLLLAMVDPLWDRCPRRSPVVRIPDQLAATAATRPGSPQWYARIADGQRKRVVAFACCLRALTPKIPKELCHAILAWLPTTARPLDHESD